MSLNPWRELREARETISRLERELEFLNHRKNREESYSRNLEGRLIEHEKRNNELRVENHAMSRHLSNVWRVMQDWKPARVVKMYEEDK